MFIGLFNWVSLVAEVAMMAANHPFHIDGTLLIYYFILVLDAEMDTPASVLSGRDVFLWLP
jgi:hypothetical protein